MAARSTRSSDGIEVRGDGTSIRISVYGRERPTNIDYFDGNWLSASVAVAISGFRADFPFAVLAQDLAKFHAEIIALHDSLEGSAEFMPTEPSVILQVAIDGFGRLAWKCKAQHPLGYGATLEFEFTADQSYLPSLISQLSGVLEKYPVRGEPV